jgi:hypothetical protein
MPIDLFFDQWYTSSSINIYIYIFCARVLIKISTKLCGQKLDTHLCDYEFLINEKSGSIFPFTCSLLYIVVGSKDESVNDSSTLNVKFFM